MKKLLLIIMILPVLGTGYLNAQKLSKNDAFDILTNGKVNGKIVWFLKNQFGQKKGHRREE